MKLAKVPQFLLLVTIIVAVTSVRVFTDTTLKIVFGVLCALLIFAITGASVFFEVLEEKDEVRKIFK